MFSWLTLRTQKGKAIVKYIYCNLIEFIVMDIYRRGRIVFVETGFSIIMGLLNFGFEKFFIKHYFVTILFCVIATLMDSKFLLYVG